MSIISKRRRVCTELTGLLTGAATTKDCTQMFIALGSKLSRPLKKLQNTTSSCVFLLAAPLVA